MPTSVTVYGSSVSGNTKVRSDQARLLQILEVHKIDHQLVDISLPENEDSKTLMRNKSGKTEIPQIFVGDEFKGDFDTFIDVNEGGREEVIAWLGLGVE